MQSLGIYLGVSFFLLSILSHIGVQSCIVLFLQHLYVLDCIVAFVFEHLIVHSYKDSKRLAIIS